MSPGRPSLWTCAAPWRLPRPIASILSRPLSYRPVNDVCGLIRLSRTMPSASKALRSKWIGRPKELVPRTTVSISERIGQPTASSVTPSSASSARWPSAVPPPWLPIAATTKGARPSAAKRPDRRRGRSGRSRRCPGCRRSPRSSPRREPARRSGSTGSPRPPPPGRRRPRVDRSSGALGRSGGGPSVRSRSRCFSEIGRGPA